MASPLGEHLPEIPVSGSHWTQQDRLNACALHSVHGNARKVSELTGIPRRTITDWSTADWWDEHTACLRQETKARTLALLDKSIESAMEKAQEAIEHGDVVKADWDQDGQERLIRAPMKGKDVGTLAAIMIDKRQILLNQPTSIRADSSSGMQALAEQFAKLAADNREKTIVSDQQPTTASS